MVYPLPQNRLPISSAYWIHQILDPFSNHIAKSKVLLQHAPMLFDPQLRFPVIRTQLLNQPPKPLGMIVLSGMRQLMPNDVIPNSVRHLNQFPVQ